MTLWELGKNNNSVISHLSEDINDSVQMRLMEMGFESDQHIKCLRRTPLSGPIVVQLGDGVYSLEQDIAQHIYLSIE